MLYKTASKQLNMLRALNNMEYNQPEHIKMSPDITGVTRAVGRNMTKDDVKYLRQLKKKTLEMNKDHYKNLRDYYKDIIDPNSPYPKDKAHRNFQFMDERAKALNSPSINPSNRINKYKLLAALAGASIAGVLGTKGVKSIINKRKEHKEDN